MPAVQSGGASALLRRTRTLSAFAAIALAGRRCSPRVLGRARRSAPGFTALATLRWRAAAACWPGVLVTLIRCAPAGLTLLWLWPTLRCASLRGWLPASLWMSTGLRLALWLRLALRARSILRRSATTFHVGGATLCWLVHLLRRSAAVIAPALRRLEAGHGPMHHHAWATIRMAPSTASHVGSTRSLRSAPPRLLRPRSVHARLRCAKTWPTMLRWRTAAMISSEWLRARAATLPLHFRSGSWATLVHHPSRRSPAVPAAMVPLPVATRPFASALTLKCPGLIRRTTAIGWSLFLTRMLFRLV